MRQRIAPELYNWSKLIQLLSRVTIIVQANQRDKQLVILAALVLRWMTQTVLCSPLQIKAEGRVQAPLPRPSNRWATTGREFIKDGHQP